MSQPNPIAINPDTQLALLSVTVKGIETHSEEIDVQYNGDEKRTERKVETVIRDVHEAKAAKKLANKVRSAFAKYVTTVRKFTVSDPKRIAAFEAERAPLQDLIDQHNAVAVYHPVEVELTCIPLAASLSDAQAQKIYAEIASRLDACKSHFERGDANAVAAWLSRNKCLGAFLPSAVAGVVDDAVDAVRASLTDLRKRRTDGEDPLKVGAELAGNLNALDTARGLVTPRDANATPGTLALSA